MDHATAMKEYAVERYLLGEMPDDEQDAFEQHYFACAECAENVRTASAFLDTYKAVVAANPALLREPEPRHRDWFGWLRWQTLSPAFTAALLVVTCYLGFVRVPNLERLANSPVVPVRVDFGTRGGEATAVRNIDRVQIQTTLGPSMWAPKYEVEIRPAAGGKTVRFDVQGPSSSHQSDFRIPVPVMLSPGVYEVTLRWAPDKSETGTFMLTSE